MISELLFLGGVVLLAALSVRAASLVRGQITVGVAAVALAALLLRLFWVTPAFVHDSFHGPLILNGALAFPGLPDRWTYGLNYGPGSFAVLGLLSWLSGRSAEGVMAANVAVSALATFPVAAAAAHLSGRPRAGLYAALLWAGSPLVGRLAHSEDTHVVGVTFAVGGIAWAAVSERSRAALWAAVVSTALAVFCRQTLVPFAFIVAGMLAEDHLRKKARGAALACGVLGLCLVVRALVTVGSSDGREATMAISLTARHPEWWPGSLASHPLLSLPRLPPIVPALFVLGAVTLWRRSSVRLSLALGFCVVFLTSLPANLPSVGVRWSFRLPCYALALVIAGAGAAWLEEAWGHRRRVVLFLVAALAAVGAATLENRVPNAEFIEYTWMRDQLAKLPRGVKLVGYEESGPAWRLPDMLADRLGVPLMRPGAIRPGARYVMPEGLGCYAWDLLELAGTERAPAHQLPGDAEVERVLLLMFNPLVDHGLATVRHPEGMRPNCARLLDHAVPFGPPGPTLTLDDSPPSAVFGRRQVTLRLVELHP